MSNLITVPADGPSADRVMDRFESRMHRGLALEGLNSHVLCHLGPHYGIWCWSLLALEWTPVFTSPSIVFSLYSIVGVGVTGPPQSTNWSGRVFQAISSAMQILFVWIRLVVVVVRHMLRFSMWVTLDEGLMLVTHNWMFLILWRFHLRFLLYALYWPGIVYVFIFMPKNHSSNLRSNSWSCSCVFNFSKTEFAYQGLLSLGFVLTTSIEAEWRIYASVNLPSLVQIMACRLVGDKPSSEPMLEYC